MDYGCIVYGAASNNILKILDPIHHQALRITLGTFRTSPVTSLCAKIQEMSLKNRRKKLCMNYVLNEKLVLKIQLISVFLNHQTQNLLKNPA